MCEPLKFSGIMPANILPFKADLSVDEPAYRKHLRWLADTPGVTGIVVNGHAAEVASLSRDERRRTLAIALDEVAGACPVIAGVYTDGTAEAVELTKDARAAGAAAVLLFPPTLFMWGAQLKPDMVLLGEADAKAGDLIEAVQRSVSSAPVLRMNLVNAEIAKLALNSYVTMKISFANMIAEMCEQVPGADAAAVGRLLGADSRIGAKYLTGALGYGGPCFPRDNAALRRWAEDVKVGAELPFSTDAINRRQAGRVAVAELHEARAREYRGYATTLREAAIASLRFARAPREQAV